MSSRRNNEKDIKVADEDIIVISDDDSGEDGAHCDESAEYKRQAEEMVYQAQRIQAEFDNYRKRTAESMKTVREDGRAEVVEKMLPALDAFGQATAVIKDKSVLEGVNMIFSRLSECLSQFGLVKIESINAEFDPNFHNAVMTRECEHKGIVIEVLQDGYTLNGKVLRAATVIVGE